MNKRHLPTRFNAQRGISMVELMIAILLSVFLLGGVIQLFVSNKSTFNNMEGISQIQDNARPGLERIKERVRMSGYMGCTNLAIQNPNNVTTGATNPVVFNAASQITGTDGTGINGSDTITVMSASLADTSLNVDMTAANSDVILAANPANFQDNDAIIITDCENIDIFRARDVDEVLATGITTLKHDLVGGFNSTDELSKPYLVTSTMVMALRNVTYTVADTTRNDESGNNILALFEHPPGTLPTTGTEIMTGVEDMQIMYGVDTTGDGTVDGYEVASGATDWPNVVSVRLRLLTATDRDIGPDPRPFVDLAGVTQTTDRRMRRPFTTTISLRNRSS